MTFFKRMALLILLSCLVTGMDWEGREQSASVIDLRLGLPCANPNNCHPGWLDDECEMTSCTRRYNTGNCEVVSNGSSFEPGPLCKVIAIDCDRQMCIDFWMDYYDNTYGARSRSH